MEEIGKINEIPGELTIEWKIQNFFSLSTEENKFYFSPSFSYANGSWSLQICSNGSKNATQMNGQVINSVGHTDLFLTRKTTGPPITLQLSFGLKSLDEIIALEFYTTINFQITEGFGIHKFFNRSKLFERRCKFAPSNIVTVICKLKYVKSFDTARNNVKCSSCKRPLHAQEDILSHRENCTEKSIILPNFNKAVALKRKCIEEFTKEEAPGEKNILGSSKNLHKSKILQDYKELFLKQENCDVVLRVKEEKFQAHKAILQARSPVFASTFLHDMKEKATGIVNIEDCDPAVFPHFLCFLYCDDADSISKESVFNLFTIADKYDVRDLKAKCIEFIEKNLSIDTFCNTITLALQYFEDRLIELATNFFIRNAEKIIVTVKWQTFAAENPTQSNELFIKFVASVKHLNLGALIGSTKA